MIELKVFLVRHGLEQRDLAAGAGLTPKTISNIMTGKHAPSHRTLTQIIEFCRSLDPNVTFESLFGATKRSAA